MWIGSDSEENGANAIASENDFVTCIKKLLLQFIECAKYTFKIKLYEVCHCFIFVARYLNVRFQLFIVFLDNNHDMGPTALSCFLKVHPFRSVFPQSSTLTTEPRSFIGNAVYMRAGNVAVGINVYDKKLLDSRFQQKLIICSKIKSQTLL